MLCLMKQSLTTYSGEIEDAKIRDTVEIQVDSKEATRPEVQNQRPETKTTSCQVWTR